MGRLWTFRCCRLNTAPIVSNFGAASRTHTLLLCVWRHQNNFRPHHRSGLRRILTALSFQLQPRTWGWRLFNFGIPSRTWFTFTAFYSNWKLLATNKDVPNQHLALLLLAYLPTIRRLYPAVHRPYPAISRPYPIISRPVSLMQSGAEHVAPWYHTIA